MSTKSKNSATDQWVIISDPENPELQDWMGRIWINSDRSDRWQFELIKPVTEFEELYSPMSTFSQISSLTGLIDLQRECTLVSPFVAEVDPGSIGVDQVASRTIIQGHFGALIDKAAISDMQAPSIAGLSFVSDSFSAWFNRIDRSPNIDSQQPLLNTHDECEFTIEGFGKITCGSAVGRRLSTWEDSQNSYSYFHMDFCERLSLTETMQICFELECLFQFLIGFSTKWPVFSLKRSEKFEINGHEQNCTCDLIFGRTPSKKSERPHPYESIHNNGRCQADITEILKRYVKNRKKLSKQIQAVRYSRHFCNSLQDRFSATLPVLEELINAIYAEPDESTYVDDKQRFIEFIESSDDPSIREFLRKHIKVVEEKSPSLKLLIERAIFSLNQDGCKFSKNLAVRIRDRRAKLFHRSFDVIDKDDGIKLQAETIFIEAMLALHIYRDLGIELAELERRVGHIGLNLFLPET